MEVSYNNVCIQRLDICSDVIIMQRIERKWMKLELGKMFHDMMHSMVHMWACIENKIGGAGGSEKMNVI